MSRKRCSGLAEAHTKYARDNKNSSLWPFASLCQLEVWLVASLQALLPFLKYDGSPHKAFFRRAGFMGLGVTRCASVRVREPKNFPWTREIFVA